MVIIEYLPCLGKQGLNVFPYPRGSITYHTQTDLLLRNQPRFFYFRERRAQFGLILDLMPTQQMHDAPLINEIKPKAFRIAPGPCPLGALGPRASLTWTTTSCTLGASGHKRAINTQHHHRTTPFARCHFRDALLNVIARWRNIQHRETLGGLIGERMHALGADLDTRQLVKKCLRFVIGHLDHRLGCALLHIKLETPRG